MKDIERIKPLLEKLQKYWQQRPDMRFGQLICNVMQTESINGVWLLSFVEDDVFERYLDKFFQSIGLTIE